MVYVWAKAHLFYGPPKINHKWDFSLLSYWRPSWKPSWLQSEIFKNIKSLFLCNKSFFCHIKLIEFNTTTISAQNKLKGFLWRVIIDFVGF